MRLFLSYRRDDSAGRAGRLFDGLTQRLGPGQVFQDVEAIKPGLDFERAVADSLESADASVVVIGPEWATVTEPGGARRLDRDDDFVRLEVGVALRSERPVVPVLVGGAQMPRAEELPEELRPLLKRQAFTVRDNAWNGDVDVLVRDLRSQLAEPPRRRRRPLVAAVMLLVADRRRGRGGAPVARPRRPRRRGGHDGGDGRSRGHGCNRGRAAVHGRRPRHAHGARPRPADATAVLHPATDRAARRLHREPGSRPRSARTAGGCWPTSRWPTTPRRPNPAWRAGTSPRAISPASPSTMWSVNPSRTASTS